MKGCSRRDVLKWGAIGTVACHLLSGTLLATVDDDLVAGASVVDITPRTLPIITSGMWTENLAEKVNDPLHARCLVLDDGETTIAVVVVDSLMLSRELLDEAKETASKLTGIPTEHMLISATHTHSAPSVVGVLGSGVDDRYARQLRQWIVESIVRAYEGRVPAKVGWSVAEDREHTHCRRWIYRSDRTVADPFGAPTVRANMIPGYQDSDHIGPAGPVNSGLSILAAQTLDGRPIAVLANFSMHYFEWKPISADYFGLFCKRLAERIAVDGQESPPVVMLSQGTQGDQQWFDFSQPEKALSIDAYSQAVVNVAYDAYRHITFQRNLSLAMTERKLVLDRRTPDGERLAWARQIVAGMNGRNPQTIPEIYAREQVYLDEQPQRELKLQAVRVGDFGITAIPCEAYGITGLKLRLRSPLQPTFTIGLANGAEGYIPPPEQHKLGGYTTWPARSAGLEANAEPKIVETLLQMMEEISGNSRRSITIPEGPYSRSVRASQPVAYWRMRDIEGPAAADASGNNNQGVYEDGVAFFLDGPSIEPTSSWNDVSRAAHFAGGRMQAIFDSPADAFSVELWFWNGMPNDAKPITGCLFSRDGGPAGNAAVDSLFIGGRGDASGRLVFAAGTSANARRFTGSTLVPARTWNHVIAVRDRDTVHVYLNGNKTPEIAASLDVPRAVGKTRLFLGGDADKAATFEGRIAEVSYYDRGLSPSEILASGRNPPVNNDEGT